MNEFWKWMEDKGYGKIHPDNIIGPDVETNTIKCRSGNMDLPTKQMLIGYMLEYIGTTNDMGMLQVPLSDNYGTDKMYKYLECVINGDVNNEL